MGTGTKRVPLDRGLEAGTVIPRAILEHTLANMKWFADVWKEEIPVRLHSRDVADDGAPQWHRDFAMWLSRGEVSERYWKEQPEARVRATRAFRQLRYKAPREYEVLYRTAILNITIEETVVWLNERAIRINKPERYTFNDVLLFLVVATDKVVKWIGPDPDFNE